MKSESGEVPPVSDISFRDDIEQLIEKYKGIQLIGKTAELFIRLNRLVHTSGYESDCSTPAPPKSEPLRNEFGLPTPPASPKAECGISSLEINSSSSEKQIEATNEEDLSFTDVKYSYFRVATFRNDFDYNNYEWNFAKVRVL